MMIKKIDFSQRMNGEESDDFSAIFHNGDRVHLEDAIFAKLLLAVHSFSLFFHTT